MVQISSLQIDEIVYLIELVVLESCGSDSTQL